MDEIVGQEHLFGKSGVLRRMIGAGRLTNMIFYGPPGTGKTTAASVIAAASGMAFHKLNATTASLADVKAILAETGGMFGASGILLYLDEIQYFNRKQHDYRYEYKKQHYLDRPEYTTDVELKVYVRYTETDVLKILHFDRITEQYRGEDGNYVIGYIRLSELLAKREVLRGKDVFMADFQSFFQELDR